MKNVTIYTTPVCQYCKLAKQYFAEHNVTYTEKNVAADHAAQEEMVKKSGMLAVPVIEIDGQIVVGFDRPRIEALLAEAPKA